MFASSGSESEDENSDIDVSVSEESDSAEVSENELELRQCRNGRWRRVILDISHFVSPTGIAVELPQDSTELDLFKLLFGDDIVDYIVAKTKLYAEQERSESEKETLRAMREEKTAGGGAKETVYNCTHCGVALCKYPCFLLYHSQL